ncbi:MAG: hypothetical protein ACTH2Q_02720 [Propionibacteriaceae bacterium]
MLTRIHPKTTRAKTARWTDTMPRSPRWAVRAAHLIAWCTVPSALWRIGIIIGIDGIYDQGWIEHSRLDTPFGGFRMILLCVITEALALLSFGLVQRWGEVAPPWLGPFAGRKIPRRVAIVVAGTGAIGLCFVWTIGVPMAWIAQTPFEPGMQWGTPSVIQLAGYAPMIIWGPLLAMLTVGYARRTAGTPSPAHHDHIG